MSDKVPMPVSGNPATKGAPDGVSGVPGGNSVSGVPDGDGGHDVHGRTAAGESGGAAYPNPHTGKDGANSGFMGHGGQTDIEYHGGGQAGDGGVSAPNSPTGSSGDADDAQQVVPQADRQERDVAADGETFKVVETSGIAAAEATGKVGTDAAYTKEQEEPGSG